MWCVWTAHPYSFLSILPAETFLRTEPYDTQSRTSKVVSRLPKIPALCVELSEVSYIFFSLWKGLAELSIPGVQSYRCQFSILASILFRYFQHCTPHVQALNCLSHAVQSASCGVVDKDRPTLPEWLFVSGVSEWVVHTWCFGMWLGSGLSIHLCCLLKNTNYEEYCLRTVLHARRMTMEKALMKTTDKDYSLSTELHVWQLRRKKNEI